jgi:ribokinase
MTEESKPDVVVIGDVDTDIFVRLPRIPSWDEGILAEEVIRRPGGKGANTAAALCKLGTHSGMMAFAGDDEYGSIARQGLERFSVDLSHFEIIPGEETYYCIMMLDPTGEKAIIVIPTATIYPSPDYIREHAAYLQDARHVHAIGLNPSRVAVGLQIAHQAGRTTSVDLDSAHCGLEASEMIAQYATILLINEQGITGLYPDLEMQAAAEKLQQIGTELVIVTQGRQGAVCFNPSQPVTAPGFQVRVKDTTGAGDCFAAALIHGYLKDWPLNDCLLFANAAAALSTLEIGGQEALPDDSEVVDFIMANHREWRKS